ncbi:MAG TPA: DUF2147 domain-containing protein [Sphingomicrobium sp.]|nr:DUF2147 domain-containing protein [Sphingomicrobium sp.]
MKQILLTIAAAAVALSASAAAPAQNLEGRWTNSKHSVIVNVSRCGDAFCGVVSWATPHNRNEGATPGTRVLSELRPDGKGVYKGKAYEPKRGINGSATVRQAGPDTMLVKGCTFLGIICKEQRWTRVN